MRFVYAFVALMSLNAVAQDNAIRFNVGSLASGLSYVKENFDVKDSSEAQETEKYHVAIGYLRHVGYNVQLVGNLSHNFKNTTLLDQENEDSETVVELGVLYNIGKDLKSSFYFGALYYMSERFSGDYNDTRDIESDGKMNGIELTVGKRFSLVENLSYVISVDYITGLSFSGDLKDSYDGGSIVRVNLATLEYYF